MVCSTYYDRTPGFGPLQDDALFCSNAFAQLNATCVAQRPGCGGIGRPCCIRTGNIEHNAICNEGATCPAQWNESTLCVADKSTST